MIDQLQDKDKIKDLVNIYRGISGTREAGG